MSIKGIIFDNQIPTAKGLRGGFHSALTDGIIEGCPITYQGSIITIGSGLMNVAGGIFQISGSETVSVSGSSGFARVKAVLDLTRDASDSEHFNQVYFAVDYASSATGFTELTQDAVNTGGGTTYEAEICVVKLSASGIANLTRYSAASPRIMYGDTLPETAPEGTIFLLKT